MLVLLVDSLINMVIHFVEVEYLKLLKKIKVNLKMKPKYFGQLVLAFSSAKKFSMN